jgi:hypothetical protein
MQKFPGTNTLGKQDREGKTYLTANHKGLVGVAPSAPIKNPLFKRAFRILLWQQK